MTTISPPGTALVTLDDLESATRTLAPVAIRTSLLPFDALSEQLGARVMVKPEVAVLSGGNIAWDGLRELLGRGT